VNRRRADKPAFWCVRHALFPSFLIIDSDDPQDCQPVIETSEPLMTVGDLSKRFCLALLLLAGLHIRSALAEGCCPPGQYRTGDQGVGGCAAIPGAGESASEENSGYWVKTWGAVASSPDGDAGSATGHRAKAAAERQAVWSDAGPNHTSLCRGTSVGGAIHFTVGV